VEPSFTVRLARSKEAVFAIELGVFDLLKEANSFGEEEDLVIMAIVFKLVN
jgi:hypothetical protein